MCSLLVVRTHSTNSTFAFEYSSGALLTKRCITYNFGVGAICWSPYSDSTSECTFGEMEAQKYAKNKYSIHAMIEQCIL